MDPPGYTVVGQGLTLIPLGNDPAQPRIYPPPVKWCNARRTKVIIAIVILSILFIAFIIVFVLGQIILAAALAEQNGQIFDTLNSKINKNN